MAPAGRDRGAKRGGSSKRTAFPATWTEPDGAMLTWAAEHEGLHFPPERVRAEFEKFKNRCEDDAATSADWPAKFRNWLLRAPGFERPGPSKATATLVQPATGRAWTPARPLNEGSGS